LNIEIEEGDVFAQSSIYELTLMDYVSEHIIRSFSLSNVQIISANEISCESLLLQTNIQTIFFDPSFVEGIKITNEFRSQTNII